MGLKTTNFYLEERKETLPEAYALIRSISVDKTGHGVAIVAIDRSRDLAKDASVRPLAEIEVHFITNRKNDREVVYKKISTPYMVKKFNKETKKVEEVEVYPMFYGWDNDIVE